MFRLLLLVFSSALLYAAYLELGPIAEVVDPSMPRCEVDATSNYERFVDDAAETAQQMAWWVVGDSDLQPERLSLWTQAHHHQIMLTYGNVTHVYFQKWHKDYRKMQACIGLPYEAISIDMWRSIFKAEFYRLLYEREVLPVPTYMLS
jgi:hypothetical protein